MNADTQNSSGEIALAVNLAETFYKAFAAKDAGTMASLYADNARFSDPAFPDLRGEAVRNMWRMLCSRSKDLKVEFKVRNASKENIGVDWTATYTFAKTGRLVKNRVHTVMTIRDGRIIWQRDEFNFWRWSAQALGPMGTLLGWTPLVRRSVQKQAMLALKAWTEAARDKSSPANEPKLEQANQKDPSQKIPK
jgi:ketosteroid isomerase-like protein